MRFKIWEERIVKDDGRREPEKAFVYFNEYLLLGGGRSLREVAEQTGKSYGYLKKLSRAWDWSKRANAYDMWLMEEHKREFEEKTKERYKLANDVGLEALKLLASNLKDNPKLKEIRAAGNLAAKLIKKESAVELDTNSGKFTNLSNKEVGDLFRSAMMNGRDGEFKETDEEDIGDGKD